MWVHKRQGGTDSLEKISLLKNVYAIYACSACRGQNRGSDPLKLELQMVVNLHVGAAN